MGVMLSFEGYIMQERGEGPTKWVLRPLGVPVTLPWWTWGSCARIIKSLRFFSFFKGFKVSIFRFVQNNVMKDGGVGHL